MFQDKKNKKDNKYVGGKIFFSTSEKVRIFATEKMEQDKIIDSIKELARRLLPEGVSLWLYGSRARGEARPDSDYDLLILVDKDRVTPDIDSAAYDLCLMGYDNGVEISPHIYPRKKWEEWTYSPFFKNVNRDKIVLL